MEVFEPVNTLKLAAKTFSLAAAAKKNRMCINIVEPEGMERPRSSYKGLKSIDPPAKLNGDKTRLHQIIVNLLKNASKFTREGTVKIYFALDRGRSLIYVHIVDSGIGIDPSDAPSIFNKFGKLLRTA